MAPGTEEETLEMVMGMYSRLGGTWFDIRLTTTQRLQIPDRRLDPTRCVWELPGASIQLSAFTDPLSAWRPF